LLLVTIPFLYKWSPSFVTFWIVLVALLLAVRYVAAGPDCQYTTSLRTRVAIVTGGNTGIGQEAGLALARMGCHVILACRDPQRGQEAVDNISDKLRQSNNEGGKVECMPLDLGEIGSIRKFAKLIEQKRIEVNILLNNAGVYAFRTFTRTKDGFEGIIGTNHLGHFLLTNLLLPNLIRNKGRIVNVSSQMHQFAQSNVTVDAILSPDPKTVSAQLYANSKLANIWFTLQLQKRLQGTDVIACCLHPGFVRTTILKNTSFAETLVMVPLQILVAKRPRGGAQTSIFCCIHPSIIGGGYYTDCALDSPSAQAQDANRAAELWDKSSKLVGL